MTVPFWIAFLAGLISFLSPCVLPLVPAYIGYMGGHVTHTVAAQTAGGGVLVAPLGISARLNTLLNGVAFVLGFTFIFVILGLVTTVFLRQVGGQNIGLMREILGRAGGALIIFFGLQFTGLLPAIIGRVQRSGLTRSILFSLVVGAALIALLLWAFVDILIGLPLAAVIVLWLFIGGAFTQPEAFWAATFARWQTALFSDTRKQINARVGQGLGSSALMGIVFAAGWTPCIGPIYGSILTLAANTGDSTSAGGLLIAYSFGLGIPFLLAALLLDGAQSLLRRLQRHIHKIELVSGTFLIVIGVLVASGQLQQLSLTFATQFADVSYRMEECVVAMNAGEIGLGELPACLNMATMPEVTMPEVPTT